MSYCWWVHFLVLYSIRKCHIQKKLIIYSDTFASPEIHRNPQKTMTISGPIELPGSRIRSFSRIRDPGMDTWATRKLPPSGRQHWSPIYSFRGQTICNRRLCVFFVKWCFVWIWEAKWVSSLVFIPVKDESVSSGIHIKWGKKVYSSLHGCNWGSKVTFIKYKYCAISSKNV